MPKQTTSPDTAYRRCRGCGPRSRDGVMPCSATLSARDEACLSRLEDRLRGAPALTPKLLSDLIAQACARFASPHERARAGIERLTRSGAWTDAALAASPSRPRWRRMALCVLAPADASHRPRRDRRSQPRDHVAGDPDRIHRGIAANGGGKRAVVADSAAGCSSGRLSGLLRQLCLIAPCRPDRMEWPGAAGGQRALSIRGSRRNGC